MIELRIQFDQPSRSVTRTTIRWALGGVLLFAATAKLLSIDSANDDLFTSVVGPSVGARLAACLTEAALGCWLLIGVATRASCVVLVIVFSTFIGAIAAELSRPRPRDCGCFGALSRATLSNDTRNRLLAEVVLNLSMMGAAGAIHGAAAGVAIFEGRWNQWRVQLIKSARSR